jgi:chaperone required for assembly of F1-ATPase
VKRFWSTAAVTAADGVFTVRLDGKPMRLPGGPLLRLRQRALADAIAAEWQAAPDTMTAEHVPLTSLAGTAQERIVPAPQATIDALAAYGQTDLLCYRAEAPEALTTQQHQEWQPWLDWAETELGARLVATKGVMPISQPETALNALQTAVARLDPYALAGMGVLVPALGSIVLGLAVAHGRLTAPQAHRLSILDELFEEERWGQDTDAARRRAYVARDIDDAARFMALASL